MSYARIENNSVVEYPVYERDIRSRFPNTSFTIPFQPPSEYVLVFDSQQPEIDHTKIIKEGEPKRIEDQWKRTWIVEDAPEEMILERTASKSESIRRERDRLLSDSDWTQLSDISRSIKTSWKLYRQELRDVTSQEGFPWSVVWPDKPE